VRTPFGHARSTDCRLLYQVACLRRFEGKNDDGLKALYRAGSGWDQQEQTPRRNDVLARHRCLREISQQHHFAIIKLISRDCPAAPRAGDERRPSSGGCRASSSSIYRLRLGFSAPENALAHRDCSSWARLPSSKSSARWRYPGNPVDPFLRIYHADNRGGITLTPYSPKVLVIGRATM
jgi:hypothetical protein